MQKIKKIVDLSHNLANGTVVYPGDPEPDIAVATTLEKEGYNLSRVILGTQSGSHVDAPYHFSNEGKTIDQMNLKYFMGNALVINVNYKKANEMVMLEEILPFEDRIGKYDIVLFRFDWYKKAGTEEFFNHPFLSKEVGEYLISNGIMTVGTDCINLDSTGGTEFPLHDMYSEKEGIIAENLAHFDDIDFEDPFVIFLPLKFIGVDGSPVRAVAVQFEQV